MAFTHGSKQVLKIQNAAGVLTDVHPYCSDIGFPQDRAMSETTTMGQDGQTYIPGLKNATIPLSGYFDVALDTHLAGIDGLLRGFEYYPAGVGQNLPKYSGNCYVGKYEMGGSVADTMPWSADMQISGAPTRILQP